MKKRMCPGRAGGCAHCDFDFMTRIAAERIDVGEVVAELGGTQIKTVTDGLDGLV